MCLLILLILIVITVNSLIRAQCTQTEHGCALICKVELKSFPTIYNNPYFALYRHVIYRWKALELNLKNLKTGDAPLLEVRPYWGIYGILLCKIEKKFQNQHASHRYLK